MGCFLDKEFYVLFELAKIHNFNQPTVSRVIYSERKALSDQECFSPLNFKFIPFPMKFIL